MNTKPHAATLAGLVLAAVAVITAAVLVGLHDLPATAFYAIAGVAVGGGLGLASPAGMGGAAGLLEELLAHLKGSANVTVTPAPPAPADTAPAAPYGGPA